MAKQEQTYVGGKKACQILGVHQRTLYNWDEMGKIETIRTPGGKRLYNVTKFIGEKECNNTNCIEDHEELDKMEGKLNIGYARVSSRGQITDLEHQKDVIREKYPNHLIIDDIGSGINLNRRGLMKLIHLGIAGKINEIVVVHKDRLTRFGYELIENIINKYSQGTIKVIEKKSDKEPEEELVEDVLQLMNVFVARMNGLRKYKLKKKNPK
jgi:putative resolvase